MKRTRILSFFLLLTLLFSLAAQCRIPVSAIRASEAGVQVKKFSTFYSKDKKNYGFTFHFNRTGGENTYAKIYLYNSSGKCVVRWTNSGKGYEIGKGETSRSFAIDPTKNTGKFTIKLVVYTEVIDIYNARYALEFMWHYTIDSSSIIPKIQFKQMSHSLDDSGSVVPCINVNTKNLKGGTVTMYIYDSYDSVLYKETSGKLKSNDADVRFSWYGETNGQYYASGEYKVVIQSSKGQKITDTFYFDFPDMKLG